jgi:all-trans-retinol 13,14-reductase
MNQASRDALIIGSGISSLTCGLLLARAGYAVTLVERYTKPGGYLHCFERYGHRFDTGAHYAGALAEGEPFRVLLEYLGVYGDDLFVPLADDGFDVLRFRDFELALPRGYEAFAAALAAAFPGDVAAVRGYCGMVREAATTFSTYNFARLRQDDDRVAALTSTSLRSVVEGLTRNPLLQCVMYAYCALHGTAPSDASFGMHALVTDSLIRGAWGFRAGGERLAQRYVGALERAGGRILQGVGVDELRVEGKKVAEVVLSDGSTRRPALVVSGIHPKATFRLLRGFTASPAFAARLARTQESVGFLGVYAVCRPPERVPRDRNYYFFDWNDPGAFELLGREGADEPESAFVCRPDRVASVGEPELYPVSVHTPIRFERFASWAPQAEGRKPRVYYQEKLALAERALTFVDRNLPGFRQTVVRHDASTPLSNLRFNGSEEGTAYGIYHSIGNTGARALGPRTHVENLLLTGQNSLFPGLLGAAVSGLRTAGNLIGMKNILRDLSPLVNLSGGAPTAGMERRGETVTTW